MRRLWAWLRPRELSISEIMDEFEGLGSELSVDEPQLPLGDQSAIEPEVDNPLESHTNFQSESVELIRTQSAPILPVEIWALIGSHGPDVMAPLLRTVKGLHEYLKDYNLFEPLLEKWVKVVRIETKRWTTVKQMVGRIEHGKSLKFDEYGKLIHETGYHWGKNHGLWIEHRSFGKEEMSYWDKGDIVWECKDRNCVHFRDCIIINTASPGQVVAWSRVRVGGKVLVKPPVPLDVHDKAAVRACIKNLEFDVDLRYIMFGLRRRFDAEFCSQGLRAIPHIESVCVAENGLAYMHFDERAIRPPDSYGWRIKNAFVKVSRDGLTYHQNGYELTPDSISNIIRFAQFSVSFERGMRVIVVMDCLSGNVISFKVKSVQRRGDGIDIRGLNDCRFTCKGPRGNRRMVAKGEATPYGPHMFMYDEATDYLTAIYPYGYIHRRVHAHDYFAFDTRPDYGIVYRRKVNGIHFEVNMANGRKRLHLRGQWTLDRERRIKRSRWARLYRSN